MADSHCLSLGIPERLHREERPEDQHFEETEFLYRWLASTYPDSELKESFRLTPGESVNRKKYSDYPADVLFDIRHGNHRIGQAILPFQVGQLQQDFPIEKNGQTVVYTYRVRHKPEGCMYPHCEVEIRSNGQLIEDAKKVPGIIRRKLREAIAEAQEQHVLLNAPLPTD
jgi:hypothetical protein